jgi:hypothetical protein
VRFVLALVTLVAAAALIALGIAQRTVFLPPDRATVAASVPSDVRYVVVPGSVLRSHTGQQRLHLDGSSTAFAAYGRGSDVTAWLSGQRYAVLRVDGQGNPLKPVVRTAPVVAGLTGGHPDPDGSDLWLDQQRSQGTLDWTVNVPATVSVLVAADGSAPAPSKVTVSWPVRVSTPYATPLIVGGSVLALLGLLLYIWALVHLRRRRGPRRKPPARMPKMPQPPKYRPAKPELVVSSKGRRAVRRSALLAGIATGAVLLTGCQGTAATPAATATATAPVAVTPAAVTEQQATRIIGRVADVAHRADRARDSSLLASRFAGAAFTLRRAAYIVRKSDKKASLPQAVPAGSAATRLILPEATTAWPRTLFAVVTDTRNPKLPPLAITLVQQTPREPYRVRYQMSLRPKAKLPDLPSVTLGANRLAPDTKLLSVPPGKLAADYGLLLRKPAVPEAKLFDTASDELLAAVGPAAKKKAAKILGSTAKISFSDGQTDPASIVALATANSGALVSVDLAETQTVKPGKSGVKVKPSGATRILSKTSSTGKGIASTYGYQLLFSVPSAGSSDRVVLLGYAQGLISAKEL